MIEYIGEKIMKAAVRYPNGEVVTTDRDYRNILDQTSLDDGSGDNFEQGFLTSRNRFVDRRQAAKIARATGQVSKGFKGELFSEDIFKDEVE